MPLNVISSQQEPWHLHVKAFVFMIFLMTMFAPPFHGVLIPIVSPCSVILKPSLGMQPVDLVNYIILADK